MLLKRLEMTGFKSFAKAVTLEFPTKITSIVGPNGSGKSNIADAIRWVLGEQSMKHLRGKKGEDLIFAGTPQIARLAKASVSLVFDNKEKIFPVEFDEVAMSRRVYRDGANEYLLNNSQVRLKDIIELLSKVGLGASQHHIIAQGDSDRILYASPKE
ncbi:MAG: AAA family ATPase, partial [Candidatus Giovannonibacteria bacterium]|nr:AAA family ATPase [Candidatus Giovannonibacteria bacterium]